MLLSSILIESPGDGICHRKMKSSLYSICHLRSQRRMGWFMDYLLCGTKLNKSLENRRENTNSFITSQLQPFAGSWIASIIGQENHLALKHLMRYSYQPSLNYKYNLNCCTYYLNLSHIKLLCHEKNKVARQLYEKKGFDNTGEIMDGKIFYSKTYWNKLLALSSAVKSDLNSHVKAEP